MWWHVGPTVGRYLFLLYCLLKGENCPIIFYYPILLWTPEMSSGMCRWRMCRWRMCRWRKHTLHGERTWIGECKFLKCSQFPLQTRTSENFRGGESKGNWLVSWKRSCGRDVIGLSCVWWYRSPSRTHWISPSSSTATMQRSRDRCSCTSPTRHFMNIHDDTAACQSRAVRSAIYVHFNFICDVRLMARFHIAYA